MVKGECVSCASVHVHSKQTPSQAKVSQALEITVNIGFLFCTSFKFGQCTFFHNAWPGNASFSKAGNVSCALLPEGNVGKHRHQWKSPAKNFQPKQPSLLIKHCSHLLNRGKFSYLKTTVAFDIFKTNV